MTRFTVGPVVKGPCQISTEQKEGLRVNRQVLSTGSVLGTTGRDDPGFLSCFLTGDPDTRYYRSHLESPTRLENGESGSPCHHDHHRMVCFSHLGLGPAWGVCFHPSSIACHLFPLMKAPKYNFLQKSERGWDSNTLYTLQLNAHYYINNCVCQPNSWVVWSSCDVFRPSFCSNGRAPHL